MHLLCAAVSKPASASKHAPIRSLATSMVLTESTSQVTSHHCPHQLEPHLRPRRQFFQSGKVLPVDRGKGLEQPVMRVVTARAARGEWIHLFPEGRVGYTGHLAPCKWGVGKVICDAAAMTDRYVSTLGKLSCDAAAMTDRCVCTLDMSQTGPFCQSELILRSNIGASMPGQVWKGKLLDFPVPEGLILGLCIKGVWMMAASHEAAAICPAHALLSCKRVLQSPDADISPTPSLTKASETSSPTSHPHLEANAAPVVHPWHAKLAHFSSIQAIHLLWLVALTGIQWWYPSSTAAWTANVQSMPT